MTVTINGKPLEDCTLQELEEEVGYFAQDENDYLSAFDERRLKAIHQEICRKKQKVG
jgi:hypothetical protein